MTWNAYIIIFTAALPMLAGLALMLDAGLGYARDLRAGGRPPRK